ncbi:hypothetical protein TELCIR_03649 [Teladorsagia circumcincta]|uniref:Uncharacterized protein n=1 Tax=Teladorsagia circumcincta TaxID=45464 RepID=A0A2G9UXW5_TELCI|nr:hypothetical protein TELCIR_03649 [Teladorsagia circumcincta]
MLCCLRVLKAERREKAKVDGLEKNVMALRRAELDEGKAQDMKELYQNMFQKFAEMQTVSHDSQNDALINERRMLEEQGSVVIIALMSSNSSAMKAEIERLSAALDATGYEGLLHETRRSLMVSMKDQYTAMKNELLRLRLANHALRIRARTAQANKALEK